MPEAKNAEEYIAQQRAAIAQNPECGNSRYNLAVALIGQKKYDEAEKELFEAVPEWRKPMFCSGASACSGTIWKAV